MAENDERRMYDVDPYAVSGGDTRLWNRNYVLVMIANFLLFFSLHSLMPVLPIYLSEQLHAGRDVIGEVMGGFVVTTLLIRPFSGYLVDSFPRKKVLIVCYATFAALNFGYIVLTSVMAIAVLRTLQGFSFGSTSVSNSTVAIDVLPSVRRSEGIGYYGISNNLAMAVGPSVALALYYGAPDIHFVFAVPFVSSALGLLCASMVRMQPRATVRDKAPMSLDRFFLTASVPEGITLIAFSFASTVLTTYVAIYSRQELGSYAEPGMFFLVLSAGLIASRLLTNKRVRDGKIVENVKLGMILVTTGFLLFVAFDSAPAYFLAAAVAGLGYGTMCPSYQSMFINLAPNSRRGTANSSYLTSWDVGAGIGILSAGYIAEVNSYRTVYWLCFALCVAGLAAYYLFTSKHFLRLRLR